MMFTSDLKSLIEMLGIYFVFFLFTLRAFYFAFIVKSDPINAIIPKVPFIVKMLRMKEADKNAQKFG